MNDVKKKKIRKLTHQVFFASAMPKGKVNLLEETMFKAGWVYLVSEV